MRRVHNGRSDGGDKLDLLAVGMITDQSLDDYLCLDEADIPACIAYGAEVSRERCFEIPVTEES